MTEILRYQRRGAVATITMDDGKVNCMSLVMLAELNRVLITAETYSPEAAVEAGFLDRVVPTADLLVEATKVANALTHLDATAHAETKLLVRGHALAALRAAIESELGSFDVFIDTIGSAMKVGR